MHAKDQKLIYIIAGPTASGKTELSVQLAKRLGNAEIINCDSVQIYKDIEIATAKPSDEEKQGVPHHLISYVDPKIKYTAADWAQDAVEKIKEIEARGATPILVGGTGFYIRALSVPFFESPKTDENIRARLHNLRIRKGPERIYKLLERFDPQAAAKLFPRDYVRTTRALEFFLQTGERFSNQQPNRGNAPEFVERIRLFVLSPPREKLYEKINKRTEIHYENGLIDEVKALRKSGLNDDTNALGAHGYRRVCEFLRGERSLESAVEQTKQDIRHYAKRQITWFKREKNAIWLEGFGCDQSLEQIFEKAKDHQFINNSVVMDIQKIL